MRHCRHFKFVCSAALVSIADNPWSGLINVILPPQKTKNYRFHPLQRESELLICAKDTSLYTVALEITSHCISRSLSLVAYIQQLPRTRKHRQLRCIRTDAHVSAAAEWEAGADTLTVNIVTWVTPRWEYGGMLVAAVGVQWGGPQV